MASRQLKAGWTTDGALTASNSLMMRSSRRLSSCLFPPMLGLACALHIHLFSSFIHSFTHSLNHALIDPSIHPSVCPSIHPSIHALNLLWSGSGIYDNAYFRADVAKHGRQYTWQGWLAEQVLPRAQVLLWLGLRVYNSAVLGPIQQSMADSIPGRVGWQNRSCQRLRMYYGYD